MIKFTEKVHREEPTITDKFIFYNQANMADQAHIGTHINGVCFFLIIRGVQIINDSNIVRIISI